MTTKLKLASREEVVAEATSWVGTPYHKSARIKGVGVDCGTFLLSVFQKTGFLSEEDSKKLEQLAPVKQDWFLHSKEEKYFRLVISHARHVLTAISYRTMEAKPGCIVVTHHVSDGKKWNHGGVVVRWPLIVHAVHPCVSQVDATVDSMWNYREICVFDPWAEEAQ